MGYDTECKRNHPLVHDLKVSDDWINASSEMAYAKLADASRDIEDAFQRAIIVFKLIRCPKYAVRFVSEDKKTRLALVDGMLEGSWNCPVK